MSKVDFWTGVICGVLGSLFFWIGWLFLMAKLES